MFNPQRLSFARRRRGLTKKQLASKVGVDPRSITAFEAGEYQPIEGTLLALVRILDFPQNFFFGDDIEEPLASGVSFRAMSKMRTSQRGAALTSGAIGFLLSDWVDARFALPEPDLPDLRLQTPAAAAVTLRQYWRIGEQPVRNMVHLLEAKGVRVFSLSENCRELDAYSLWRADRPFIFLNTYKSAEHSRFDSAHELAHLVLHRHGQPSGQTAEKEAQAFASAFLMPEASVRAEQRVIPSLPYLIKLKQKWAVSLSALVVRLHQLGMISDWHNRSLFIEMQRHGYRIREPNGIAKETSQVWDKVFSILRSEGIGKQKIANELSVFPPEIEKLVFGLVTMGVSTVSQARRKKTRKLNHLRLVDRGVKETKKRV